MIVRLDGKLAMAVIPAKFHVDLALLKRATNAKTVALASEARIPAEAAPFVDDVALHFAAAKNRK